ncbi:MAG: M1 family metallopeptidase [Clostridia bacterium]|nr:M1 family metallopeptidase [Clostridia bacterium]
MKKIIVCLMIAVFITSIYACSLNVDSASKNLTNYRLELTFDDVNYVLNGSMSVNYYNKTETPLSSIYFNLYPSAFRDASGQEVIGLSNYDKCYYNGISYGGIDITKVYNNSSLNLNFEICGTDENILIVYLQKPVEPETYTNFNMDFSVIIPNINHRFGYGENTVNLGNFFPIACVFENGEWAEMEYYSYGDPFYSEVANFEIELTYPKDFIVATTGKEIANAVAGLNKISVFKAKAVRDFAIVLSEKFQVISTKVNNTEVFYYFYNDEHASESLETSKLAIETYSELFGNYPYDEVKVIQSNFVHGGMEYPSLVLISDEISNYETYTYVIVHELAHQWWYGVVGNNQTKYAWLDEGLTEFSCALFYEQNPQYDLTYEKLVQKANSSFQVFKAIYGSVLGEIDTSINRSLNEFSTEPEYYHLTYVRGFLLMSSVNDLIGSKKITQCLKEYYIKYAFKIATPENLIGIFEKVTMKELEEFFNSWLDGKIIEFD